MQTQIKRSIPVHPSARVLQMRGIFDVPTSGESISAWEVSLPIEDRADVG